jgi:diacylglycerol kinase family enzyme
MIILLNPSACGGRAVEKWHSIESDVRERLGPAELLILNDGIDANECVGAALNDGHTEFVAAGGDGTVNLLLESIMSQTTPTLLANVKLGAIGLGSSNDLHKPFRRDRRTRGVPCRLDFDATATHDVGVLTFEDEGSVCARHWLVNASIGITAEANFFFNQPDAILRTLKGSATSGAIAYAALHALTTHRNRRMAIAIDDEPPIRSSVTNIGIVKNPHFAGTFSYGSPHEPASGCFYVHLCENMSRSRVLFTLWTSSRSGFSGLPHTRSWRSRRLAVQADRHFAVELDGEVVRTTRASFSISQGAIQLCVK